MIGPIVVTIALLLVPGAGAALALAAPGAISLETRFALAFGLGYGVVAGVATLLALAHVFSRATFIVAVILATLAVWLLAIRRAPLREHASALLADARAAPFPLAAGLVLVLAVAASRPFHSSELTLAIRSGWRYWADGLEVAAAGHFPARTHQWGIEFPTTVSKAVLNAFEGGVSFLLGADPLGPMQGIQTVTAIGLVAALFAIGRELGLGVFAPVFAAIVALAPPGAPLPLDIADVRFFTAENAGRLAAFSALLVGIYALLRTRNPRGPVIVTGVVFALAGLTHLVPTLVAGVMLVLFSVASTLLKRGRLLPVLARGAGVLAVFGVFYVGTLALSGGDLGWQTAGGAAFQRVPPDVDPTLSFARGELVQRLPQDGHFLISPRAIFKQLGEDVINRPDRARIGLLVLAGLSLAGLALALRARSLLPAVVVAWGLTAAMLAVAFLFSFRYETFIPGNFGAGRMYVYVGIVVALLICVVLEAVALLVARRRQRVLAALALAAGALALAAAVERTPRDQTLPRAEQGLEVIEQVANVVPCGSRMLVNARTAGTWEATTGRLAVTEGHAPYLRPNVIPRVLPVIIGANEFFDDPETHRDFLDRQRIEYLVTVKRGVWIGSNGERRPRDEDAAAVSELPGVHPVLRTPLVSVFAVGPAAPQATGGQPDRCPL